jgi:hypothetical protein
MTSVLNVDSIAAKDGTSPVELTKQSAAKVWINFDGTGTISIRDSFSVSSIDDDGTGLYSYNLSTAMASPFNYNCNSNAARTIATSGIATTNRSAASIPENGTSVLIGARNLSNAAVDCEQMHGNIHGDLA